ncbi:MULTISPECIES: MBL fold metallo-hydrolase [Pseudomonas]|nr:MULTISPECIES: MBL fold metallo-hydrolase [Pseudomonas]MDD2080730.1 MBL fold metallo-hydrolase [Pseudomonas putida]PXZ48132.1 MBL fold metallo-hydrolase [Pseudomonas sp. SMT-1]QDW59187.1 MBL fold metallo-hydrolase [Pseudomonas sp. KBS0802]QXZ04642.1 MBL fold metallo-hydrolase [Pseudomonas putida]UUX26315.1 MBL fold metallo-hydrolase [Pseudomonas putida]
MNENMSKNGQTAIINPGWYRFKLGSFEITVVSDGPMPLIPPSSGFSDAPPEDVESLLSENFLPTDRLMLGMNALVINTGTHLVLVDTGMGQSMGELSRLFGPSTGHLMSNLAAAGFSPNDIDVVAITHAHPDHCWGLVDEAGEKVFPKARVAIAEEELMYWLDISNRDVSKFAEWSVDGAIKNITPYLKEAILVRDGGEVVPGITGLLCPGHSPGHSGYVISSDDTVLVTIGDLAHHHILALRHPEWKISYDTDSDLSVTSRRRILDFLAQNRLMTHGYHFPWPGIGHVAKEGDGYRWIASPSHTYLI